MSSRPSAGRWRRVCVALSLAINLIALIAVGVVVRGRGGLSYLRAVILRDPTAHSDPGTEFRGGLFELSTVTANSRPIVFFGDSLIAEGTWNEFFETDAPVLNRGIGGETSLEVLRRVPRVVALRPTAVFLMVGANDAYFLKLSPRQTAAAIGQIVSKLRAESPDTIVYLQSVLPSKTQSFVEWGGQVNELLARFADNRSVFFIDFRDAFMENGRIAPNLTTDGLHLSAAGYKIWRHAVAPAVAQASRRRAVLIASRRESTGRTDERDLTATPGP